MVHGTVKRLESHSVALASGCEQFSMSTTVRMSLQGFQHDDCVQCKYPSTVTIPQVKLGSFPSVDRGAIRTETELAGNRGRIRQLGPMLIRQI